MSRVKHSDELTNKIADTLRGGDDDARKALYHESLPEGLTPQICEEKDNHDKVFSAAFLRGAGIVAVEQMAEDKTIDSVTFEAPMGNAGGKITVTTPRETTYSVAGKTGTVKGKAILEIDFPYGKKNSALMAASFKAIKDFAAEKI